MVGNASDCFKNGIILTSLSRNFFTDLRKASVDILKPQFASSISQSARDFFLHFLVKKKSLGKGPQSDGQRSLSYLVWPAVLISSYSVQPAFLALIPPSFISLNAFVTFFGPLQPHSSSHNWGKYENSRFNSDAFGCYRKYSHTKQPLHTKSSRLWMSE